jgi:hypothetical protein
MSHKVQITNGYSRDRAKALKVCEQCADLFPRDTRNTWAYWERARYCSRTCSGAARRAAAERDRKPMAEDFARWIDKSGDCWLWNGARDKNGYGAFSYAGKTRRAHAVALELDGRKPAKGEYACHSCDNPPCVNPAHLYPGTPTQNMADAKARGRTCQGAKQHMAKLCENDVLAIRSSQAPVTKLARQYGVSHSNISMIQSRKTWKHLP